MLFATMKHATLIVLLLVFAAGCQLPGRMARVTDSRTDADSWTNYERAYPGRDGVYIQYDWTLEHDLKVDFTSNVPHWSFYEVVNRSFVVLNPEAEEVSRFELTVGPRQTLDKVRLRLRTTEGTNRAYSVDDLKQERLPDGRLRYVLEYAPLGKGTVIEEGYEVRYADLVKHPLYEHDVPLRFDWPCEQLRFRYIYPQEWAVQVKRLDPEREVPLRRGQDRSRETVILTYEKNKVPAFDVEPFGPTFKEVAAYFQVMVTGMTAGNALAYEAPSDWPELAGAYTGYVMRPNDPVMARLGERATEISNAHTESLDRLHALLGYVQHRYRVESKDRPDGYAEVFKEKAGGAHQIVGVTQALLRKAGFDVQYLLVHSAEDGYFDPDFISPSQWAIPALEIRGAGAASYYVFPTLKDVSFGYVPDMFVGQTALIVTEQGFGGFTELTPGAIALNTDEERYTIEIAENEGLRVEEEKILRGKSAYETRRRLSATPEASWGAVLQNLITFETFTLHDVVVTNLTENNKALLVKLTYTLDRRVRSNRDDKTVDLAGVLEPISRRDRRVNEADRTQPLRVRQEERIKKQVLLNHPDNWVVLTPLADERHENTYGSIEKAYSVGAGQVGVYQQLWLKPASAPRSAVADFAAVAARAGAEKPLSFTDAPIVARTTEAPEPGGPWTLVVAADADEARALDVANRYTRALSDHGYRIDVLASRNEGPAQFRVVVGLFDTRTELETTLRSLQTELPFDTWMLELPIAPALNTAGTPEQEHPD